MDLKLLVEIHQLRNDYSNEQSLRKALKLIETQTLNTTWHDRVVRSLQNFHGEVGATARWKETATDKFSAEARNRRDEYHRASQSQDQRRIAQAAIDEAMWHINGGDFRSAQAVLGSARSADESREHEVLYYTTQLELLQNDLSVVIGTLSKRFQSLSNCDNHYKVELLLSLAYALWKYRDYADVANVLLHVVHHPFDEEQWPWLRRENLVTLSVICSIVALSRENLQYLLHSDMQIGPLLDQFPYLRSLIDAYLNVDIRGFVKYWADLKRHNAEELDHAEVLSVENRLKNRLLHQYLAVRTRCSITEVNQLFGFSNELELGMVAQKQNLPLEIDPIEGTVTIVPRKAERRAWEYYIDDAFLTIWHSIEAKNGPGLESSSTRDPDREIGQRRSDRRMPRRDAQRRMRGVNSPRA